MLLTPIGLGLGAWIMLSALADPVDRWRRKLSQTPAIVGMALAHFGLGLFVLSISVVESYTLERDVALGVGDRAQLGRYEYRFDAVEPAQGPNWEGVRAKITVLRDGELNGVLYPEKRNYWVQRSVMTEAGIDMQPTRDVFAALGEDLGAGRWSVRAQVRPLINYVWFAAFLMALGGVIAATDRRYRTAREGAGQRSSVADGDRGALPAAGAARVATGEA